MQSAVTAAVEYWLPIRVPPQVPPIFAIRYPESGVIVKLDALPSRTVCGADGEMEPPIPAVGVTI